MKDTIFTLRRQRLIAKNTYEMVLEGDTDGIRAGQFVNLKLDGFYLRRPISVCDVDGKMLTIIYKVVGEGTRMMSDYYPHPEPTKSVRRSLILLA